MLVQLTDLPSSSGRSYGYTGGYRSNYDAASRTFGGSNTGISSDRTLGYLPAYGGVSSLKEKFDVSSRPSSSSGYTSSLDRYSGRSNDYSGRLGSTYSSDLDLSRLSTGSSRSYNRTSSYTPSVGRASSPAWSSSRSTRPDYRYLFICLFVCLFVYFISLFVCLFVCPSVCLCVYLFICLYLLFAIKTHTIMTIQI